MHWFATRYRSGKVVVGMSDCVINLIGADNTGRDDYGNVLIATKKREVFARPSSITSREFYAAGKDGLQPAVKMVLADILEYQGEAYMDIDGKRYLITRTYENQKTGEIELTGALLSSASASED